MRKQTFLFTALVLLTAGVQTPTPVSAETTTEYYGRAALANMPDSAALLHAYDAIVDGVENYRICVSVFDGVNPIDIDGVKTAFDAYRRDYGAHFWLGGNYSVSYTEETVTELTLTYSFSQNDLVGARERFQAAIDLALSGLNESMSDFEKEVYLHDWLVSKVTYVDAPNAHDAYGALVEGKAVCEGYAEALQTLYQEAGLTCFVAHGEGVSPTTGQSESHAWNIVEIDGEFYHVDPTWNDQGVHLFHAYFNLTDEAIGRDHIMTETAYALPTCTATAAHYFSVYGGLLTEYDAQTVGELLRGEGHTAHVYLTENPAAFVTWFKQNVLDIAKAAGVYGAFSYQFLSVGREVVVTLNTCKHELKFVVETPPSCTETGTAEHYLCKTCGKLFLDADATAETQAGALVLPATGHEFEESGCQTPSVCVNCGEDKTTTPHEWREAFSYDENAHWHDCVNCDEQSEKSPHSFGAWQTVREPSDKADGLKRKTCACGYSVEETVTNTPTELPSLGCFGSTGGATIVLTALGALFLLRKRKY